MSFNRIPIEKLAHIIYGEADIELPAALMEEIKLEASLQASSILLDDELPLRHKT